jgi:hypothetical protein
MTLLSEITRTLTMTESLTRYFIRLTVAVALLLLIPLTAMQFTEEVQWTFSDFVAAAILLGGAGTVYKLIAIRLDSSRFRAAAGLGVGTSLLVTWINLAVGIIGGENNPVNDLFFGVLLVGFTGAVVSRFQPKGLSITLFAMAFSQFIVPIVAAVIWRPVFDLGAVRVFILNALFVILFACSGVLFRSAAAGEPISDKMVG